MVIIFDDRTTIGMIRLYAKEAIDDLLAILEQEQSATHEEEINLGKEFTDSADAALDDIFHED